MGRAANPLSVATGVEPSERPGEAVPLLSTASPWGPETAPRLQRNGEEGVEAAAVADHDALAQVQRARVVHQRVEIAARREEIHRPVAHDADDEERRLRTRELAFRSDERRQADEVAVRLALGGGGLTQRGHAVAPRAL